jgi:hypothetical protein
MFDRQALSAAGPRLTCFVLGVPDPIPPTDVVTFRQRDLWTTVGINRKFGGIGVELALTNPTAPNASLNIVDARSAGGAAWQTTTAVADAKDERIVHVNQAAGNSARNWGLESEYEISPMQGIRQQDWLPLVSNDYRDGLSFTAPTVNTSPCHGTGIRIGDGKGSITPSVGAFGTLRLTNSYLVRWSVTGDWKWVDREQALYMNPKSARVGDLRIYVAQPKHSIIGPIRPGNMPDKQFEGMVKIVGGNEDWFVRVFPASYAVLVFKVAGRDVGIAVHLPDNRPFAGFFRFRPHLMCKKEIDYCRPVQWHSVYSSRFDRSVETRFSAGEMSTYTVQYDLGSPEQLRSIGYPISP